MGGGIIQIADQMLQLLLKIDFFVGIQQILVADVTQEMSVAAYPLGRRSQLPMARTASDQLGFSSFGRYLSLRGSFGIHTPLPFQPNLKTQYISNICNLLARFPLANQIIINNIISNGYNKQSFFVFTQAQRSFLHKCKNQLSN